VSDDEKIASFARESKEFEMKSYLNMVALKFCENKVNPTLWTREEFDSIDFSHNFGECRFQITISKNGEIDDRYVFTTSGYSIIDSRIRDHFRTFLKGNRFAPFPFDLESLSLELKLGPFTVSVLNSDVEYRRALRGYYINASRPIELACWSDEKILRLVDSIPRQEYRRLGIYISRSGDLLRTRPFGKSSKAVKEEELLANFVRGKITFPPLDDSIPSPLSALMSFRHGPTVEMESPCSYIGTHNL